MEKFFGFRDVINSVDKNVRIPLENAMVLFRRVRDGKVPKEKLESVQKKISENMFSANSYLSIVFYPYMDEVKNK